MHAHSIGLHQRVQASFLIGLSSVKPISARGRERGRRRLLPRASRASLMAVGGWGGSLLTWLPSRRHRAGAMHPRYKDGAIRADRTDDALHASACSHINDV